MACPDLEQLERLADGDLDDRDAREIEEHLTDCEPCRQLAAEVSENLAVGARIASSIDPTTIARSATPGSLRPRFAGFRVIREIGRGGAGVVYEVEQERPRRRVAVKAFHGAIGDEYQVRLFQREAEALARLKHPAIAAIHEANCTADHQKYFVMELVEGVPLDEYTRDAALPLGGRLRLFGRICEAVHYAHQRGVIHRDLKPSNILVDADGKPKVLDFGLSRIVDDDAGRTMVTEVGRIQGTLHYMSPEQARGNPDEIDLRTDVYALGVVLYQLVTGQLPYVVDRSELLEALRIICESEPVPPRRVNRELPADVEKIILKAIDKAPDGRYQSAIALAEDVERYLCDQPVLAASPSLSYQLRKLVVRHKVPFGVAAAVFALIVAFGVWMGVLYRQADHLREAAETERAAAVAARELADERLVETVAARDRAESEAGKALAINEFLRQMLASVDPGRDGREVSVAAVLDRAAENVASSFEDEPEVRAALQHTIGTTYIGLGLLEEAESQLRAALATRIEVLGEEDDATQVSMSNLASVVQDRGRLDEAEKIKRRVLEIRRRLYGDADRRTRISLNSLANLLHDQGKLAETEALRRTLLDSLIHDMGENNALTLSAMNNLALLLRDRRKLDEAEPLLRRTLAGLQELYGPEHPYTLVTTANLGLVLRDLGRVDEALELARRNLEVCRRVQGAEHPETLTAMHNLASGLITAGRIDEAEPMVREVLRLRRRVLGDGHPETLASISNLGELLLARGQVAEATQCFAEASAAAEESLPPEHFQRADYRSRYAGGLLRLGRDAEAEPLLLDALQRLRLAVGDGHPFTQRTIAALVSLYEGRGDEEHARQFAELLAPAASQPTGDER